MTGFAIRIFGRGVVTTVNDRSIETYEEAERAASFIRNALGESCEIERLLIEVPARDQASEDTA